MQVADQAESKRANPRTPTWLQYAADPAKMVSFCNSAGIGDALETAVLLVQKHLCPISQLAVSIRIDPEHGDQFIVIHVTTRLTSDAAPEAFENLTRELVTLVEREKRKQFSVYYTVT